MKVVDLNVLLNVVNDDAPDHRKCLAWWMAAFDQQDLIALPWVVILGFLRLATRQGVFDRPLTVAEAIAQVNLWLDCDQVQVIYESENHWPRMQELLVQVGTGGNLTTDIHLAIIAIDHQAVLVSCDTDFARFTTLRWENPTAIT
jgi:toxin-antitoxin system PIN domain toxin